ncbi:hypothetical protein [Colwellia sp. UCD-KL20]|uniref:hypothetical protein n=1 Tax=Colwellia sp. UCD-KL20 TaxID=1917165 RepID=UPI000970BE4B|nr:hypothetical protein [Colwellia sp. UCD-KL20]
MSVLIEFIPNIFVALAFDFILYITGAGILQAISFGGSGYKLYYHSEFKRLKEISHKGFIVPYIVGLLFYIVLISLIVNFNL